MHMCIDKTRNQPQAVTINESVAIGVMNGGSIPGACADTLTTIIDVEPATRPSHPFYHMDAAVRKHHGRAPNSYGRHTLHSPHRHLSEQRFLLRQPVPHSRNDSTASDRTGTGRKSSYTGRTGMHAQLIVNPVFHAPSAVCHQYRCMNSAVPENKAAVRICIAYDVHAVGWGGEMFDVWE